MKKLLPRLAVMFFIATAPVTYDHAQTLTVVPNPDGGLGWQGGEVEYNGNIYFTYNSASNGALLGMYNGDTIVTIANPTGAELAAPLVVVNDTLYLEYFNRTLGVYQIASFDGTNIILIPNPDNSSAPFFSVGIYNNKLLFEYQTNDNSELAEWSGGQWKIFGLPSGGFTYSTPFTQYKNDVYAGYQTSPPGNLRQLLQFNDTVATLVPNPDGATSFSPFAGGFQADLITWGNYLYFRYVNINGVDQLAQYDGNSVKLIPNPDGGLGYYYLSLAQPIIYDSALYIPYSSTPDNIAPLQLGRFDGKTLTVVPNPDAASGGYEGAPIVYDSSLYFQYEDVNNVYRLAKYNDTVVTLIDNPQPAPSGYANYYEQGSAITPPIIYGRSFNVNFNNQGNLYMQYENLSKINQLGQYTNGGDSLKLIPNPDTAAYAQTGYRGSPFLYNDLLYINYSTAKETYNFAYLDDLSLPVSLLNFTAQQKGSDGNLLQWQTASEDNSSYFNIQRSSNGTAFMNVGKVAAAGNSNALLNYSYVDAINDADYAPAIYYRLQEVDKDGRKTYSKIAIIRVDGNGGFSITPNPASGSIVLSSAVNAADAVLVLHDMGGKTLYSAKAGLVAGGKTYIPAAGLANGMYILTITSNNITYQLKVVKGAQ